MRWPASRPDLSQPVPSGSLWRRLVLSTLVLLFAVLVSLGLLVNAILSDRLHADLHQRLTERAKYATVLAARGLGGQQLADALTGQGITGSVQSGGETYVGRDQPRPPGPGGRPQAPPNANAATTSPVSITQQGDQLFARVDIGANELLLTTSQAEIEHTLSVLKTTELAAGAAFLLVAGLLSFAIVRRALAPLRKMSALADGIRAGDRGLRLRPARPDTDLGRTATAIDAMLESLESAESDAQSAELRMRQFLADASHDLRTPLAVMSATAEDLLRADPGRTERERRLVDLVRESRRAGRLVDDLLLMTRLEDPDPSSALLHHEVDLTELVTTVVDQTRLIVRDRTIELTGPSERLLVIADADRLTRVLTNLLDNARQASRPGGRIEVGLSVEADRCVIDVRDDGCGIRAGAHEKVFDRFVRLDETRRRDTNASGGATGSGAGLGLPIARAIARAHGGDLTSVPVTVGAHLRLTLPRSPEVARLESRDLARSPR